MTTFVRFDVYYQSGNEPLIINADAIEQVCPSAGSNMGRTAVWLRDTGSNPIIINHSFEDVSRILGATPP